MKILIIILALMCGVCDADVHDRNIVDGDIRSEYEIGNGTGLDNLALSYVNNGLYGDEGCLFDAAASSIFSCPGRRGPSSYWLGTTQGRDACGGDDTAVGDSWQGCLSYSASPYFSVGTPANNDYWVIHANHDPSFDQCREGPPSLSQSISNHEVDPEKIFNISATDVPGQNKKQINIKINANEADPYCDGNLAPGLPFLSVGSHFGAGNSNFVANVPSLNSPVNDYLKFKMRLSEFSTFNCAEPGCPKEQVAGSHAGFFVVAEWNSPANPGDPSINYPKFVWVDLFGSGVISDATNSNTTSKWSWPIFDSFFWPGGEIAFIGANVISQCEGLDIEPLSLFNTFTNYTINLTQLFSCANDLSRFQDPIPTTGFNILGVHFFAEIANATEGKIEISVIDITIDSEITDIIFKDGFE